MKFKKLEMSMVSGYFTIVIYNCIVISAIPMKYSTSKLKFKRSKDMQLE